jgi:hypothetical protein
MTSNSAIEDTAAAQITATPTDIPAATSGKAMLNNTKSIVSDPLR